MTSWDLPVAFGLGLMSSLHCAQMCGPIVLSYSMATRGSWKAHLAYNGGRIATYSVLGAVAGAAGHALGLVGRMAGFEQVAAVVCGVLLLITGTLLCGVVPRGRLVQLDRFGAARLFSRTVGGLMLSPRITGKLALGMLMGLLPCGLLYAALFKASSTGSAISGAASMAAFGLGTSGSLMALGAFSSLIGLRPGRWSNLLSAAGVIILGLALLWRGIAARVPGTSCHAGL